MNRTLYPVLVRGYGFIPAKKLFTPENFLIVQDPERQGVLRFLFHFRDELCIYEMPLGRNVKIVFEFHHWEENVTVEEFRICFSKFHHQFWAQEYKIDLPENNLLWLQDDSVRKEK